jgi:pimeloyl-ACP methyl ester carboxylesterase
MQVRTSAPGAGTRSSIDVAHTTHRTASGGRRLALLGAAVLGLLAVAYAAICGYMAWSLTQPERQPFRFFPEQYGLTYESVEFPSRLDAIALDGWLLLPSTEVPYRRPIVVVHGKAVDRTREAHDHMLEISAGLVQDGHPVLLFDLRGCGRSGGERYTLGTQEVRDVGGAIDFLQRRGLTDDGVDLLGYSMGGATALLDAPGEPLVRAVAEDSGYAELGDLIDDQLPKASHLPNLFNAGTILMARPLVGIDLYAIRPVDHVAALAVRRVPLLVIHGDADSTIPVRHGQRIAAVYGPVVQTLFVPGAEHVRSYETQPAAYLARLGAFFDQAESTPQQATSLTQPHQGEL